MAPPSPRTISFLSFRASSRKRQIPRSHEREAVLRGSSGSGYSSSRPSQSSYSVLRSCKPYAAYRSVSSVRRSDFAPRRSRQEPPRPITCIIRRVEQPRSCLCQASGRCLFELRSGAILPRRINSAWMSLGHCMGGWMALAGLADNPNTQCAVVLAPREIGTFGTLIESGECPPPKLQGQAVLCGHARIAEEPGLG